MTLPPRVVMTAQQGSKPPTNVHSYILSCLAAPDEGSDFAQQLAQSGLAQLPMERRLETLLQAGYLALLYPEGEGMVGHAFLQRHGAELHLFSLTVNQPHRGQDIGWSIVVDLLAFARELAGIERVRLSKGVHGYFAEQVLPRVAEQQAQLHVTIDCDSGFVTLSR